MTTTAKELYYKESKTVFWMPPLSLEILKDSSKKVLQSPIREWLISLQQDFHANHLVLPENEKESKTKEISGLKLGIPFALYDPDSCSLKTSQISLIQDTSIKSSVTFPKSGIMLNGRCWALMMWEQGTKGKDCGYWPTPRAGNPGSRPNQKGGKILAEEAKRWPTPIQGDAHLSSTPEVAQKRLDEGKITLSRKVQQWPTPRNRMTGSVIPCRSTDKFNNLESVMARRTFPTPNSADCKIAGPKEHSGRIVKGIPAQKMLRAEATKNHNGIRIKGQLNPDWVEWLMGWPVGWTSLEPIKELIWLD